MPWGSPPSIAASTRSGARKASETVMLIFRALQFSRLAMLSAVRAFRNPWHYNLDLWQCWRDIKAPTLVLRGMHSDLLPFDNHEPGKDVGKSLTTTPGIRERSRPNSSMAHISQTAVVSERQALVFSIKPIFWSLLSTVHPLRNRGDGRSIWLAETAQLECSMVCYETVSAANGARKEALKQLPTEFPARRGG
jgi:hypothetical protein